MKKLLKMLFYANKSKNIHKICIIMYKKGKRVIRKKKDRRRLNRKYKDKSEKGLKETILDLDGTSWSNYGIESSLETEGAVPAPIL